MTAGYHYQPIAHAALDKIILLQRRQWGPLHEMFGSIGHCVSVYLCKSGISSKDGRGGVDPISDKAIRIIGTAGPASAHFVEDLSAMSNGGRSIVDQKDRFLGKSTQLYLPLSIEEGKVIVVLDRVLPTIVQSALYRESEASGGDVHAASSRQRRVAACEVLHFCTLFIAGQVKTALCLGNS